MNILWLVLLTFTSFLYCQHESKNVADCKYVIGHWPGGMGAGLASLLEHLQHCESHHLVPVIHWEHGVYYNPNGFNGTTDEWEYYFQPVSDLIYDKKDEIHQFYPRAPGTSGFSYNNITQEKRNNAYKLISKYVNLNNILKEKVNNFYENNILGKRTIAIHMRGTDKCIEETPVSPSKMVNEALKYADNNTQFFLATNEKRLLEVMSKLLRPRKVIYYDCYRSKDGRPLHTNGTIKTQGKPHVSQLGEDVIVEMWLMAKCDMLIHTLSNVSAIPLYINPNMPEVAIIAN